MARGQLKAGKSVAEFQTVWPFDRLGLLKRRWWYFKCLGYHPIKVVLTRIAREFSVTPEQVDRGLRQIGVVNPRRSL